MAFPKIKDDGKSVELDLHGARLHEGLQLIERLLPIAQSRGRSSIRIIFGSSTSDDDAFADTLKNRILDKLATGAYKTYVTSHWVADEYAILSPMISTSVDRRPISIFDIDN